MKTNWIGVVLCAAIFLAAPQARAVTTGSWGWGFGISDPAGPFMTGYSDTDSYQENVYFGGGAIQADTWQELSFTIDKRPTAGPTITVSVAGSPSTTSPYGTVSTPTDIFLVFGEGVNGLLRPFGAPIFVRNLELKLDGSTVALETFASFVAGEDILGGSHPDWSDPFAGGVPLFVQNAPGGFKAAAITDANGFAGVFSTPTWTFPAISQGAFDAANTATFSVLAYWPSAAIEETVVPEPASLALAALAGLALARRSRRAV